MPRRIGSSLINDQRAGLRITTTDQPHIGAGHGLALGCDDGARDNLALFDRRTRRGCAGSDEQGHAKEGNRGQDHGSRQPPCPGVFHGRHAEDSSNPGKQCAPARRRCQRPGSRAMCSRAESARAYSRRSVQSATAASSQQCSRSSRIRVEIHQTAGW